MVVGFGLMDDYPEANARHYAFMLEGLRDVAAGLAQRGIALVVRRGNPPDIALRVGRDAAMIVCDRGYLRHQRQWRDVVADAARCAVVQVESDVVAVLAGTASVVPSQTPVAPFANSPMRQDQSSKTEGGQAWPSGVISPTCANGQPVTSVARSQAGNDCWKLRTIGTSTSEKSECSAKGTPARSSRAEKGANMRGHRRESIRRSAAWARRSSRWRCLSQC